MKFNYYLLRKHKLERKYTLELIVLWEKKGKKVTILEYNRNWTNDDGINDTQVWKEVGKGRGLRKSVSVNNEILDSYC